MATNGNLKGGQLENRYELRNRYVFAGDLVMQTALHIGGGNVTLSSSDSPIVLTPDGKPFIPGSSFKGALRSTVEKMVPSLPASANLFSCALIEIDDEELPTVEGKICSTARQGEITRKRRQNPNDAANILKQAVADRCNTCQLFGSPFAASRLNVDDLYLSTGQLEGLTQKRDGVAIDRDSETAKNRLKYDFEVVPASVTFVLRIVLENASAADLQLICVGLSEFVHGFGVVGGKRSRGLGVSKLTELKISALELEHEDASVNRQRLRDYLVKGELPKVPGEEFLGRHIESIFAGLRS